MKALGFRSARSVELMVAAMRRGYSRPQRLSRRSGLCREPARPAAVEGLCGRHPRGDRRPAIRRLRHRSPHRAKRRRRRIIRSSTATGNAVAVTYTINGYFGAGVIAPGTGFFLNDEMDDFTAKPGTPNLYGLVQGEANAIAPGKRPLSSMAPTLVEKDGRVFLVLGSPGGSRIITTVLETDRQHRRLRHGARKQRSMRRAFIIRDCRTRCSTSPQASRP